MTTVYIGGVYEWQAGASTAYYTGPDGPVAFRRSGYATDNGVYYLLRDHLGSSSVIVHSSGSVAKREFYYPFGGNRGSAFSDLTTQRFTGQYHEQGLPGGEGLSYYSARWYDAQLGRFVSADTIVPEPGNPQDLNRLAYVRNNPLGYTDPSGHDPWWINVGTHRDSFGNLVDARRVADYLDNSVYNRWSNAGRNRSREQAQTRRGVSAAADFAPGIGDVKGMIEAFTGRDSLTGEALGNWRWLGLVFLSEMRTFRHADEIVEAGYRISEKSIELADAIVPASVLRFTQNTASATTRFGPKMYLDDLTGWLATDGFRGAPLNVVQIDGTYYSLDHRRLIAAKILNVEVPINILDLNDPKVMREFQRKRSGLELGTEGLYIDISGTSIRITVDGRITSAR